MDITENNHGGNTNSEKAHAAVAPFKPKQARIVADLFEKYGPSTTDELEARVCEKSQDGYLMPRQTLTARIADLRGNKIVVKRIGYGLVDTGQTRSTRNGHDAEVSELVPYDVWLVKADLYTRQMKSVERLETSVLISELKKRGYQVI